MALCGGQGAYAPPDRRSLRTLVEAYAPGLSSAALAVNSRHSLPMHSKKKTSNRRARMWLAACSARSVSRPQPALWPQWRRRLWAENIRLPERCRRLTRHVSRRVAPAIPAARSEIVQKLPRLSSGNFRSSWAFFGLSVANTRRRRADFDQVWPTSTDYYRIWAKGCQILARKWQPLAPNRPISAEPGRDSAKSGQGWPKYGPTRPDFPEFGPNQARLPEHLFCELRATCGQQLRGWPGSLGGSGEQLFGKCQVT